MVKTVVIAACAAMMLVVPVSRIDGQTKDTSLSTENIGTNVSASPGRPPRRPNSARQQEADKGRSTLHRESRTPRLTLKDLRR